MNAVASWQRLLRRLTRRRLVFVTQAFLGQTLVRQTPAEQRPFLLKGGGALEAGEG